MTLKTLILKCENRLGNYRGIMKKILLNLILTVTLLTSTAFASDNSLSAVILEGTPGGYNVILRTDKVTTVKKSIQPDGALLLDLKNISTAINLDTKYINTRNVNNMVVENAGNNEVKIYIQAQNIEKADIIFDTPASAPVIVSDGLSKKQIGWIGAAFLLTCLMAGSFKKSVEKDEKLTLKNDLTEREIRMYRELKSDILVSAKIDSRLKEQRAMRNMANAENRAATIRTLQKLH